MTLLDEHWDEIWKLLSDVWAVETWRDGDLTGTWDYISAGDEEGSKKALNEWAKQTPECKDVTELRKWVTDHVINLYHHPHQDS